MSLYLKTPKHLHTVYTNKSAWKTEGLAQSVLNMVVTTFMDRDACLDSILVYVQIQIKVEEDEFSLCPLSNNNNKKKTTSYLTLIMLQAGKASLSANAPACVAVWGWEELAGCVRRRALPLASGIASDPGDWKGKKMGDSSVYQMFWEKQRIKSWKDFRHKNILLLSNRQSGRYGHICVSDIVTHLYNYFSTFPFENLRVIIYKQEKKHSLCVLH